MFIGEYEHTLNSKGRITMPVKFRAALGSTFIATRGLDQSLFIYTEPEWQLVVNNIKQLPLMERNARTLTRLFFSGATALTLDKQGRIILPNYLLDYAQLTKSCTIIGVGTRIEVWSTEIWQSYYEVASTQLDGLTEDSLIIDR